MANENLRKVFVGNVPFDCSQNEFEKTFIGIKGFIKGEIVTKQHTNTCRGFGFVTLDTVDNANELKERNDIFINGRKLRFTEYTMSNKSNTHSHAEKNYYIFVEGLPDNSTRQYLEEVFTGYVLGRHYVNTDIDTGRIKNTAMIEVTEPLKYKELLSMGSITDKDGNQLELHRWRTKTYRRKEKQVTKYDLYKAFMAGRNLGIIEGHKLAKRQNR